MKNANLPFTIAVVQQKGGVGKTTLSTSLAAAAHLSGRRTLIVDMDRQGSAIDWCKDRAPGSKLEGLAVKPAFRAFDLPRFREITRGYECVFLDGGKLGELTQAAAVAADLVLFPVRPGRFDFLAMDGTTEALDLGDLVRAKLARPPVRRAYVLNQAPVRSRLAADAEAALVRDGFDLLGVVHWRAAFGHAAMRGETVLTISGAELAREEIENLWRALENKKGSPHVVQSEKAAVGPVRLIVDNTAAKASRERRGKNQGRASDRGRAAR